MQAIPLKEELLSLQTLSLSTYQGIPIGAGTATVLNSVENTIEYFQEVGNPSPAEEAYKTQLSIVTSDAIVFASPNQGIGEVTGLVTLNTGLGLQAPQGRIEISPGPDGEIISTIADPSGNYDLYVPLGTSGFNYSTTTFSLFDPISGTVLGSEVVDLSGSITSIPTMIAPLQGGCNDNDADNPDADDPDCD